MSRRICRERAAERVLRTSVFIVKRKGPSRPRVARAAALRSPNSEPRPRPQHSAAGHHPCRCRIDASALRPTIRSAVCQGSHQSTRHSRSRSVVSGCSVTRRSREINSHCTSTTERVEIERIGAARVNLFVRGIGGRRGLPVYRTRYLDKQEREELAPGDEIEIVVSNATKDDDIIVARYRVEDVSEPPPTAASDEGEGAEGDEGEAAASAAASAAPENRALAAAEARAAGLLPPPTYDDAIEPSSSSAAAGVASPRLGKPLQRQCAHTAPRATGAIRRISTRRTIRRPPATTAAAGHVVVGRGERQTQGCRR